MFKSKGGIISINGKSYNGDVYIGADGVVTVDGVVRGKEDSKVINVTVEGNPALVSTASGDITVNGSAGRVDSVSGNVTVAHSIHGNVSTVSGDVEATRVLGAVQTVSGDIYK